MIRGGQIDLAVPGAMEVSGGGDMAVTDACTFRRRTDGSRFAPIGLAPRVPTELIAASTAAAVDPVPA